jgi:hypothetical protein
MVLWASPAAAVPGRGAHVIGATLAFLRQNLDAHLRLVMATGASDPGAPLVVLPDGDEMDPMRFAAGAVTLLISHLEEERLLRAADPYLRRTDDGQALRVQPDVRLVLSIALVARFKQYDLAWTALSHLLTHMQSVRVFEAETTPGLPAGVQRLVLEFHAPAQAEANGWWGALRSPMRPTLFYRLRLLAFQDAGMAAAAEVTSVEPVVRRID